MKGVGGGVEGERRSWRKGRRKMREERRMIRKKRRRRRKIKGSQISNWRLAVT